ncbi:MAG: HAMP domain-containing protein, partial [Planctomycetes bacterium]|nr:HAMP domain-containing protein [Planctomycetota bacterium]
DIEDDLAVDGLRLREKLHSVSDLSRAALRSALQQVQLRQLESGSLGIQEGFAAPANDWVTMSRADYSIAALDSLRAEDHRAKPIHKARDWWIVAVGPLNSPAERAGVFAAATSVNDLIGKSMTEVRTISDVIPVGDALFLAVAVPFFEESTSLQRFCALEDREAGLSQAEREAEHASFRAEVPAIGVAVTLTELSSDWARRNRLRKPEAERGGQDTRPMNEIFQVIFDGPRVTATSMPEPGPALAAFSRARSGSVARFRAPLEISDHSETYIGLALNFDDGPFSWDRPGFITLKSFDQELVPLHRLLRQISGFGAVFAILGAFVAYGAAWLVIRRLRSLQVATDKVRGGNFEVSVPVTSRDEVGTLSAAFNNMIKGLQALGLYTDSVLARSVLDNPELLGNKAARHEGTILFTDIRNFTGITESMDAAELTAQLNEYFTAIGEHVKKEGGYLDKFIGDAVMAFWGPPFLTTADYAVRACRAALLCMRATADLRRHWQAEGRPMFFQRIGVATGEVVVGNIGSATKKNFTVIGDSVNLASRLEGASKIYGTEILVDERTADLAGSAVFVREIDEILVRGKQKPVRVFELLGMAADTTTRAKRLIDGYGRALSKYRANDFAGASGILEGVIKSDPEDGPSKWLLERCRDAMKGHAVPKPIQVTKSYGPMKDAGQV